MADTDGGDGTPPRRALLLSAFAVVVLGGLAVAISSSDEGTAAPSPLFDEVEQLTPASLPDGWARCGGDPSDRAEATPTWWAQTFGPTEDGDCTPLVTVTQVPPSDHVRIPRDATNGGIGEEPGRTGAKHWADLDAGSRGLYTTASGGQLLVVEACCGEEATGPNFDLVAVAVRAATREQEPARCTEPHSDLDAETFLVNFFARHERVFDAQGCPIRGDIVSWRTEPPWAHCFAGVRFLRIGDPVGTPFGEDARMYTRDPDDELHGGVGPPDPGLDLNATVPTTATNTGFHQNGQTLWVDETDDSRVYIVTRTHVEAWPRDPEQYGCS